MSRVNSPKDARISYETKVDEYGLPVIKAESLQIDGWNRLIDEHGFIYFVRPGFKGCLRVWPMLVRIGHRHPVELFYNQIPLSEPQTDQGGHNNFGSGLDEELQRMIMSIDLIMESQAERENAMQSVLAKVGSMSDDDLVITWRSLGHHPWGKGDYYVDSLVTMDVWAETIYMEMSHRRLPLFDE